jgi:hypothetical protein
LGEPDTTYHKGKLEVNLDSFLRRSSDDQQLPASWLPDTETVIERVDPEEGIPTGKEIVAKRVKRVRRTVGIRSAVATSSVA